MIVSNRDIAPETSFPLFGAVSKPCDRPAIPESLLEDHELPRRDGLCSGGYNEAFIVQYWTSYTPRY